MRLLKKLVLNFEISFEYAKSQLQDGNLLSKELLRVTDFKKGIFYTLLPLEADLKKMYEFNLGGILPTNPTIKAFILGKERTGEEINSLTDELAEFISKEIHQDSTKICAFEDVIRNPEHPHFEKLREQEIFHYIGQEVYYLVNSNNTSQETLLKCIFNTNAFWHFLCVLTKYNSGYSNEKLKEDDILQLAKDTTTIVLGAYDGEGYIFWEKTK